jgi:cyclase
MDKDGTKSGFELDITKTIVDAVDIPIIASGGAGNMGHFKDVFDIGADAALAASIFHYKQVDILQLKKYLQKQNINTRI